MNRNHLYLRAKGHGCRLRRRIHYYIFFVGIRDSPNIDEVNGNHHLFEFCTEAIDSIIKIVMKLSVEVTANVTVRVNVEIF